ncbi:universal stress protein [Limibaculum sp. M0105]|uniref:Universal stress protein n=1 Tax=Thermohalobaculum xanthum TaxID=2753746 RepID=A0A8J7MAV9_9RHOB|nr:universal stress protein [Thermohalobaculum xanthum]MBK0400719.1 universal stress protein [Thermohalobaculum xanthum]
MEAERFRHILVPVDPDAPEASEKALARAAAIARSEGARLSILAVVPVWREDLGEVPRDQREAMEALRARHAAGIEGGTILRMGGSISGRIITEVADTGADLVVMASHNPRASDFLIGSNAAHVALHVPVSVMVVR